MFSSPARHSANRANAARSTGPRTPEGKAASSTGTRVRVSLSHSAYASDDTLLAAHGAPRAAHEQEQTHSVPGHAPQPAPAELTADGDSPALLSSFTSHYMPAGPAETLLVRRIVAATLRIDLLARALDALLELGERRALVDHLADRFALDQSNLKVRDQPNWSAMLRRYDGNPGVPPTWGPDPTDDPALDPDPARCTLAYTLSSPRAALLMRHEATAERRLHASMRELHRLQSDRRTQHNARNEPTTPRATTARNEAITAHAAVPWNEAIPGSALDPHATPRNEPTSPDEMAFTAITRNEPTTQPLDTVRIDANNLPNPEPLDIARDTQLYPDRTSPPPSAHPVDVKNEPTSSPLSDMPASMITNEPTVSPLPTPSLPARDTRITRNEPIPFPATSRPTPPAISRVGDLVAWDRYAVPSSDVLERLIRDAGRRDDDDQQQSGAAHHASRRHPRRVKR